jgi:hypothetical protein
MLAAQSLEIVHHGPDVTIGAHASLLVLLYRSEVSLSALVAAESAQARVLERHPKGTLLLTLIDSTVPLPAEGTRTMVATTFRRMAERNAAAATVIFGDGFWASAMRSTLTALTLLVRPPCPQRTFADIGQAVIWLGGFEGARLPPVAPLVQELESLRARH